MIIEEYNKGEHANLKKFIEKMTKTKNVVYTFSNILDFIEDLDELENPILGKLPKGSIEQLKISDYKSENEFEKEIEIFLNDSKKKICLIKFKTNEGNFLNYIKFFIENKEKDNLVDENVQPKKAFIFIVYLSRINNSELKELFKKSQLEQNYVNKKILKETISLSSDYYQIFIDNLNGDDILTINDIFNKNSYELYEQCLDFDNELRENFYTTLNYMKYNIASSLGELNEKTYVNKLINYIKKDNDLVKDINECIRNQLKNEGEIISKVFKSEFIVDTNDIDMVSVIQRYLSESYVKKLSILYYKIEKDQFFSSILSENELRNKNNDEENNNEIKNDGNENEIVKGIINRTRKQYLNNLELFNIENEKEEKGEKDENEKNEKEYEIIEKQGMNEINIILGLKLPGVKQIISSLIKKFKNEISIKYKKNENSLRDIIEDNDIDNAKNIYKKKLKTFNDSLYVELDKNNIISQIDKDSKNKFFDLFLEDYYTLFIDKYLNKTKIFIDNNDDKKNKIDYIKIKKFLKLIVKKRIESDEIFKEDEPIKLAVTTINWIESYSLEISNILEMFCKINIYVNDLNGLIEEIINKNQIQYEISKRSKEYTSIVNKPLFYAMESILKVNSNDKIYKELIKNPKEFSKLLQFNREIFQLALKMEGDYDLYSKEVYSLQEIISILECLVSNKKLTSENIEKVISFFSNESKYISSDNENEIINEFKKLYDTLVKLIGNDKSFNKIISIIFKNEFIKITKESYRKELLEFIMGKDELIYINKQIFKLIIVVESSPKIMKNNKKYILERQNYLLKSINSCKKPSLEETVINIFEAKILSYFEMIPKLNFDKNTDYKKLFELYYKSVVNKNPNETLIIFNLSLEIFKECIGYLDNLVNNFGQDDEKKNYNLYKLYCIAYIKIYLNKLAHFIDEQEQYIPNIDEITSVIKGGANNKFRTVIKIYVFKLFYNITGKNYDNMISTYNLPKKGFDFVDILINQDKENKYIKEIICQEKSPTIDLYKDFPLLKYFTYAEYRIGNDFIKELGPEEKYKKEYPLLYKYLKEKKKDSNVNKLICLNTFNEFSNYMIEYYSFKISREEAKSINLNDSEIYKEPGFKNKSKAFLNSWNKIKSKAIKYKDYPKMEEKELSEEDKLIYFLNDDSEQGFGMYIAAAYQNFINWQNEFLEHIIKNASNKEYFNWYLDNMKKRIPIHDACSNQIINLKNCLEGTYDDFKDLLNIYSRRKIFNKNGSINYSNYNIFEYDFSTIEEELANLILPGKCLFEKENDYFVTFWGEGFNGGKSNILQAFCKKQKQLDLGDDEKNAIIEYFRGNKIEPKNFFISMQLIIFYLINNDFDKNEEIINIIEKIPEYVKIEQSISEFFNDNETLKKIKVNKILSVFSFFEHLCYNELCETLQNEYKENIKDEIINEIKEKFDKNKYNGDILIKDLAAAVRRFISRYLVGKKQKTDINPKSMLLPQLKRVDLWNENNWNLKNLEKLVSNVIEEFKLTVGQSYNFYEIIKDEDSLPQIDKHDPDNYPKENHKQKQKKNRKQKLIN